MIRYAEVQAVRSGLTLPAAPDAPAHGEQRAAAANSTPSPLELTNLD